MDPMKAGRRSSIFAVPEHFHKEASGSSTIFGHDAERAFSAKPKIQYENTYQLEPTTAKFKPDEVSGIIEHTLHKYLEGTAYDAKKSGSLCKTISAEIRSKVRAVGLKRHRVLATVTLGQKKDQGVRVGSRCIWDDKRDSFASAFYENHTLFAVAQVYVVYFE